MKEGNGMLYRHRKAITVLILCLAMLVVAGLSVMHHCDTDGCFICTLIRDGQMIFRLVCTAFLIAPVLNDGFSETGSATENDRSSRTPVALKTELLN